MNFKGAASLPFSAQMAGTIPNVNAALNNWTQKIVFGVVTKTVVAFQIMETVVDVTFNGVMQPLKASALELKPEAQRTWNWWWVHADPSLVLSTDDVIRYRGTQYRVMAFKDWRDYGYVEYELVEDWQGVGPEPVTPEPEPTPEPDEGGTP